MSGPNLVATRANAFRDMEDPIARLNSLVIVARKYQEAVLEYRPEVAEMLLGSNSHLAAGRQIGRVIAISEDDHDALDFIMLELVFAIRALHGQYFNLDKEATPQSALGAGS